MPGAMPLRRASWDEALDRVASEIRRIQEAYGRDAFAVYSGSSLATENTYLMGKFARVALRTKHIDYNGRLCMVSAAAANKKAFGIDRAANPWPDMLSTQVMLVAGSNVAECFPVMSNYVWGARDRGAEADRRRSARDAARAHRRPVRAAAAGDRRAFFNGVLHVIEREGLLDEAFIADADRGLGGRPRDRPRLRSRSAPPRSAGSIPQLDRATSARSGATRGTGDGVPRPRASSTRSRAWRTRCRSSTSCSRPARSAAEGKGYGTITGQGNGQGGREHGQKADQLPGARDIEDPEHRAFIAEFWGIDEADLPARGRRAPSSSCT